MGVHIGVFFVGSCKPYIGSDVEIIVNNLSVSVNRPRRCVGTMSDENCLCRVRP